MSFETQISQLSSSDLDKFFDGTPAGTPNADNLEGGSKTVEPDHNQRPNTYVQDESGIPYLEDEKEVAVDEKEVEVKADDKKVEEKADEGKADNKEETTTEEETTDPAQVTAVLKNTVEFLVKNGQWADFEGREDLEITEEVYADLAAKQDEYRVTKLFDELVDSTGAYGKAIIGHIKNGGNPDEIIDLFKEQKQLEQIDASSEAGKQAVIEKYYKEVSGFKPENVEKKIKRLLTDNEIETEYNDIKDAYKKYYDSKLEKVQEESNRQKAVEQERKDKFTTSIKSALDSNTTLSPKDRALISTSILDFKHDVGGGKKVNDFYVKFAEMQANPEDYIELVRFVMDPANYKKTIAKKEESIAAKAAFNFIKGNATLQKTKSPTIEQTPTNGKVQKGTDFSLAYKR